MADTKLTALTSVASQDVAETDEYYTVVAVDTVPESRYIAYSALRDAIWNGGWTPAGETWTYASADSPTFTFTITGDKTSKYYVGQRIKLTQTTVKYFIITAVAYSAVTTVTVYGGTDYTLANAAITLPYFSRIKAPDGFPLSPAKWTVEFTDSTSLSQASPATTTIYNVGSVSITIPIGVWRVYYEANVEEVVTTSALRNLVLNIDLSTTNNTFSDVTMRGRAAMSGATGANTYCFTFHREKTYTLASKTVHYLNASATCATDAITSLSYRGDLGTTVIRAICSYL